ncbi:hypothetical protein [Candidatus Coxiella mudrowiae]|uniref:hypothetical protein n=1 Tax=Candidatus Coxiella mudrowiae TaxID=2054173 RepID=UPI0012FF27B1|nr:hypothetical protein [Candidatus Coxiella mudrowiae]
MPITLVSEMLYFMLMKIHRNDNSIISADQAKELRNLTAENTLGATTICLLR